MTGVQTCALPISCKFRLWSWPICLSVFCNVCSFEEADGLLQPRLFFTSAQLSAQAHMELVTRCVMMASKIEGQVCPKN